MQIKEPNWYNNQLKTCYINWSILKTETSIQQQKQNSVNAFINL